MIIYVNDRNEIKDVNTTSNKNLTPLEISDEWNPFSNWPVAKICCYRVTISEGIVTMMTPYVDTRIMEHLTRLGSDTEVVASELTDTQLALVENYFQTLAIESDLTDTQLGLVENYMLAVLTADEVALTQQDVTDVQLALVELYNLIMELVGGTQ